MIFNVTFFLFWAAVMIILSRVRLRKPHAKSKYLAMVDEYVDEHAAEEISEVLGTVEETKSLGGQLKNVFA